MPPGAYRIQRRIERAMALLSEPRSSIKEVAHQLGYCDAYAMANQFKQVTSLSPGKFRRQNGLT